MQTNDKCDRMKNGLPKQLRTNVYDFVEENSCAVAKCHIPIASMNDAMKIKRNIPK